MVGEILDKIFLALKKKESIAVSNDSKKRNAQVLVHLSSIKQHVRKSFLSPPDHITPLEEYLLACTKALPEVNQSESDDPCTLLTKLRYNPTIDHMFQHYMAHVPAANVTEVDKRFALPNQDNFAE